MFYKNILEKQKKQAELKMKKKIINMHEQNIHVYK